MRLLVGHKKDVRAVAYLPDGRLVSCGSDRTVRIWDVLGSEPPKTIMTQAPKYALAVAPDGSTIAYAGRYPSKDAGAVPIWTYSIARTTTYPTYHAPFRPPHSQLVTYYPHGVPRSVWTLSYSADGRTLAAAGRVLGGANVPNGGGGHWFTVDGPNREGPLASTSAYTLRFARVGSMLAVTADAEVAFYASADAIVPVVSYPLPSQWAAAVTFLPNSPLAVVGVNSWLYFVHTTVNEKPQRIKTGFRTIAGLDTSPDGRFVFVGGKPGGLEVYDAESRTLRIRYDFGVGGVHAVSASQDGHTVAIAGDEGLAVIDWDG